MSGALRLIIFDVDGTLVDSQGAIVSAMTASFAANGVPAPARPAILTIVGLSLDHAMLRLVPDLDAPHRAALVQGYKDAYHAQRLSEGVASGSPLYPGALKMLKQLGSEPYTLLGVATGKSRRGLDALIEGHGLEGLFVTRQVADDHPSKPHPSMVLTALVETGCAPEDAAMIGDTSFDMEMAAAACVAGIGVSWGYHPADSLRRHARKVIDDFAELPAALGTVLRATA